MEIYDKNYFNNNGQLMNKKSKLSDKIESKEMEGQDTYLGDGVNTKTVKQNTHEMFLSPLLKLFFDSKLKATPKQFHRPTKVKGKFNEFYSNASAQKVYPYETNSMDSPHFVDEPPTFKINLYSSQSSDPKLNNKDITDSRCDYIVEQLYLLIESLTKKDSATLESIVKDIFIEDCTFKTPAVKEPLTGRHHILEMHKSFMRSWGDFDLKIISHDEANVNGSTVITMQHTLSGMLFMKSIIHFY